MPIARTESSLDSAVEVRAENGARPRAWSPAIVVVVSRTAFALLAQALVAFGFLVRGHRDAWSSSIPWWSVYGTLADIGCLMLLVRYARREGLRIRDLIGLDKRRWLKDLLTGLGCFLLIFPLLMVGGTMLSGLIVYGTTQVPVYPGMLAQRVLPLWAVVYSLSVWWMIWSVTEETTYQAYSFVRFERVVPQRWMAFAIVGFWWTAQHCFFPFIPDWKYVAWRFIAFLPGVTAAIVVYSRTRRLPVLIAMHWPMDITAVLMTLTW